jgi:hypothetical protein
MWCDTCVENEGLIGCIIVYIYIKYTPEYIYIYSYIYIYIVIYFSVCMTYLKKRFDSRTRSDSMLLGHRGGFNRC